MEDVETLLEIVSLFSCGDTLLLFLPTCKWINFLRLIWLMFSVIHCSTLHNFHRSILNLSSVQSCFICCKLEKNSCRLSKQWRPSSDAALFLRCLIWVYTVCQSQKYLMWTQTVVTLIRLDILIWVTVCKCPQNAFGQNYFKFKVSVLFCLR